MIYTRAGQLQHKEGSFVKDWPEDSTCAHVDRRGGGKGGFELTRTPLFTNNKIR